MRGDRDENVMRREEETKQKRVDDRKTKFSYEKGNKKTEKSYYYSQALTLTRWKRKKKESKTLFSPMNFHNNTEYFKLPGIK